MASIDMSNADAHQLCREGLAKMVQIAQDLAVHHGIKIEGASFEYINMSSVDGWAYEASIGEYEYDLDTRHSAIMDGRAKVEASG